MQQVYQQFMHDVMCIHAHVLVLYMQHITRVWVCGYCTSSIIIIRVWVCGGCGCVGGVGVWILYMQHITRVWVCGCVDIIHAACYPWVCGVCGCVDVIHAAQPIAGLLGENILCSECERYESIMICLHR